MTLQQTLDALRNSHDLRLPAWGPYTKRYMGFSHLPEPDSGVRFDVSVFPGLYRRGIQLPNVNWESNYHPWEAAPDLAYVRHRHQLIWKDQVYADIDFCRLAPDRLPGESVLVRAHCVNATDADQTLVLHWLASLHDPNEGGRDSPPLQPAHVTLPPGGVWVDGLSYEALSLGHEAHRANLSYDGLTRGEVRASGFVGGFGLGQGFGLHDGDAATYRVTLPSMMLEPVLVLRYRLPPRTRMKVQLPGLYGSRTLLLRGTGKVATREVRLPRVLSHEVIFTLVPLDHGLPLEIDGFALVPAAAVRALHFEPVIRDVEPRLLPAPREDALMLHYSDLETVYGLAWGSESAGHALPFQVRQFFTRDLDATFQLHVHDHVRNVFFGSGAGEPGAGVYTNVFQRPIFLPPHSSQILTGLLCAGPAAEVREALASFDPADPAWNATHRAARARAVSPAAPAAVPEAGARYEFSQARMAATLLTNVVYPVRTRGTWIRHYTPGRWWDSLYTWDSGFIGLGLAELDFDRALDNLNAYLTEPGTEDAAFIHHGSPVPTQFYAFRALWDLSLAHAESEAQQTFLRYLYPRLRQYHRFLAGWLGSSTTRTLQSGLIRTWDYFYNSGGWDDYPPQLHVHRQGLQRTVTPVVSTAQVIRTAKILRSVAHVLDEPADEYEDDIAKLSAALQAWAWDEEAGYFSYVVHDKDGAPVGVLRHESGTNFNMGMDGAAPLIAGVCTPEQEARLVAALMSPDRMWSRWGLSTVDQSAPYYRDDGYWNGAVWMPHQWFFWKALLDLGRAEEAHQIAVTALEVWQAEVARSYNCFEHFIVQTGRGAGWHHFGGLSTPVLAWYGAYFRPGRLTVGLDMWITSLQVAADHTELTAQLRHEGAAHHAPVVIATLAPGEYEVIWNGAPGDTLARYPGCLEVHLPQGTPGGTLQVRQMA
jgi:hypothetical protein